MGGGRVGSRLFRLLELVSSHVFKYAENLNSCFRPFALAKAKTEI
eukprot:UN00877